jgi:hypothetical protein
LLWLQQINKQLIYLPRESVYTPKQNWVEMDGQMDGREVLLMDGNGWMNGYS